MSRKKKTDDPFLERLAKVETRLEGFGERLVRVETRLDGINKILADLKKRVETVDSRLWYLLAGIIISILLALLQLAR